MVIVLDRSCSMNRPPMQGSPQTKWQLASAAINVLTTKYAGKLDFGLIMFPDQTGDSCLQDGAIYVPVGPGREAMIASALVTGAPASPCTTPVKPGIDQVALDPVFAQPYSGQGRRSFVLFISDGQETCGGGRTEIDGSVKALFDKGYPTYVVGFGGAVDKMGLDSMALVGGVPRPLGDGGAERYYQADDGPALQAALDAIAGAAVGTGEVFTTGCDGTPCPDGRCFGAGESCVNGSCLGPAADLAGGAGGGASMNDAGAVAGDAGAGGGMGKGAGCGCEVGAARGSRAEAGSRGGLVGPVSLLAAGVLLAAGLRRRAGAVRRGGRRLLLFRG
jgi:hypothetical protein